jgi:hypothetical protein
MTRRYVVTVSPIKATKARNFGRWEVRAPARPDVLVMVPVDEQYERKADAVSRGAAICRDLWKVRGIPAQLRVRAKSNAWGFERTYGNDPARRPG